MSRSLVMVLCWSALLVGGCLPLQLIDPASEEATTAQVPSNPFGNPSPAPPASHVAYAPASTEVSVRVDAVGRKVLAANPQTGLKPLFATYRAPQSELFHTGTRMLHITTGLVDQCKTDAQLAALLAHELAAMVAEREALAPPRARNPQQRPPADVPIGNAAQVSDPDRTHLAELAKYDRKKLVESAKPAPPPDPDVLARIYLEKAGFARSDLDSVRPLLESTAKNFTLEKQFKTHGLGVWTAPNP